MSELIESGFDLIGDQMDAGYKARARYCGVPERFIGKNSHIVMYIDGNLGFLHDEETISKFTVDDYSELLDDKPDAEVVKHAIQNIREMPKGYIQAFWGWLDNPASSQSMLSYGENYIGRHVFKTEPVENGTILGAYAEGVLSTAPVFFNTDKRPDYVNKKFSGLFPKLLKTRSEERMYDFLDRHRLKMSYEERLKILPPLPAVV